jgi:hypothetical protein
MYGQDDLVSLVKTIKPCLYKQIGPVSQTCIIEGMFANGQTFVSLEPTLDIVNTNLLGKSYLCHH